MRPAFRRLPPVLALALVSVLTTGEISVAQATADCTCATSAGTSVSVLAGQGAVYLAGQSGPVLVTGDAPVLVNVPGQVSTASDSAAVVQAGQGCSIPLLSNQTVSISSLPQGGICLRADQSPVDLRVDQGPVDLVAVGGALNPALVAAGIAAVGVGGPVLSRVGTGNEPVSR